MVCCLVVGNLFSAAAAALVPPSHGMSCRMSTRESRGTHAGFYFDYSAYGVMGIESSVVCRCSDEHRQRVQARKKDRIKSWHGFSCASCNCSTR